MTQVDVGGCCGALVLPCLALVVGLAKISYVRLQGYHGHRRAALYKRRGATHHLERVSVGGAPSRASAAWERSGCVTFLGEGHLHGGSSEPATRHVHLRHTQHQERNQT